MTGYPAFTTLLSHYLTAQDRSASWLAQQLGLNASTVNRWLHATQRPGERTVVLRIAQILDLTPPELDMLLQAAGYPGEPPNGPLPSPPIAHSPLPGAGAAYDFIAYDDQWVGREALIQEVSRQLQGSGRLLVIVGMTGIGKTALAERLSLALAGWLQRAHFPVFRLNFDHQERKPGFAHIATQWLTEWRQPVTAEESQSPQQLIRRLIDLLRQSRALVLIDAFEKALLTNTGDQPTGLDEGWQQFLHGLLSAETLQSRLIITSQELPEFLVKVGHEYPNRWICQPLDGLVSAEQLLLFAKMGLQVSPESAGRDYLLRIGHAYAGHPLALRAIAGEIVNDYRANVPAYWQKYGEEIATVERDLAEAQQGGKVEAAADQWRLDRYSIALQRQVRYRLDKTFARLRERVPNAYLLICVMSRFRRPVEEEWWLEHLALHNITPAQQQQALQALRDRYLLDDNTFDANGYRLVGLHALLRSIALEHGRLLFPDNSSTSSKER